MPRTKLSETQAQNLIDDYVAGSGRKELALKYNISEGHVKQVVSGKCFRHLWRPSNLKEIMKQRHVASCFQVGSAGHAIVTKEQAQKAIYDFAAGKTYFDLASTYGLSEKYVYQLVSGASWNDLDRPSEVFERIKKNKEDSLYNDGWADGKHQAMPSLTEDQSSIITGSMLGDGHITKPKSRQCCRFTVSQTTSKKYGDRKEYVESLSNRLMPYSLGVFKGHTKKTIVGAVGGLILERQSTEKRHSSWVLQTCNHPVFDSLEYQWYLRDSEGNHVFRITGASRKERIKIVPPDMALTPLAIAIWYCDDGSNVFDERWASISTQGFTDADIDVLRGKLKQYNMIPTVHYRVSPYNGRKQPILKFSGASYDALIDTIKPFVVWECFQYKIEWRDRLPAGKGTLTKDVIEKALVLKRSGMSWDAVGKRLGTSPEEVRLACTGKNYKWLDLDVPRLLPLESNNKIKLSVDDVKQIRHLHQQGVRTPVIAKEYKDKCTLNNVYAIVTGRSWSNIA